MELKITVYDENDQKVKECTAQTIDIRFGEVSALMELLNIESMTDTSDLLKVVYKAWKQLKKILGKIFPDMNDEDWDNVSVKEMLPIVVGILKNSFSEMLTIPKSKNE